MKIRCVIVDDEPLARKGLRGYVEQVDFLELAGECQNAMQLNTLLKKTEVDLLFLDIEMPYLTGIEFLSGTDNLPLVIITSAYEKYALQGYELRVTDYLLKPVSITRFLKAVNNVYAALKKMRLANQAKSYFFVKTEKQLKKIVFDDINFIEGMENYVIIHTVSSREIVYNTLKQLLASLPDTAFLRTHRSYIVNLSKVTAISGNRLELGDVTIPVGRNMKENVINRLLRDHLLHRKNENLQI